MAHEHWFKSLRAPVACLTGACLGALLGGLFHGPLLAFVGAIFGAACAAHAAKLGRVTRRWV
ncbi:MAG: hypothetical protein EOO73_11330 [Myxococcales bacterium]|nr:MAG: hypothetical protein EOO73_11330 [Myxococcales bacterium]